MNAEHFDFNTNVVILSKLGFSDHRPYVIKVSPVHFKMDFISVDFPSIFLQNFTNIFSIQIKRATSPPLISLFSIQEKFCHFNDIHYNFFAVEYYVLNRLLWNRFSCEFIWRWLLLLLQFGEKAIFCHIDGQFSWSLNFYLTWLLDVDNIRR